MTDLLYISDLDGTLLHSDVTLSTHALTTRQQLLRDGAPITFASARSIGSMGPILQGLEVTLPVIEFNGAFLSDLHTGEHLWINDMHQPFYCTQIGC